MTNDSMFWVIVGLVFWNAVVSVRSDQKLNKILDLLLKDEKPVTPQASKVLFFIEGKEGQIMEAMKIGDKKKVSVKFVDKDNFEAKVDGKPAWQLAPEGLASLVVSEDGLSAEVVGLQPGSFMLTLTADADMGEGVKPILGSQAFDVLAGEAVAVQLLVEDVVVAPVEPVPEVPAEPVVEPQA